MPADLVAVVLAEADARAAGSGGSPAGIDRSTSSRTASPKRRRRSSSSIAMQQVVGLVLLDRQVGVAGDPEQVVLEDLHAR